MTKLKNIIDLNAYPIHETQSLKYKELVNKTKKELDRIGC